MLYLQNILTTDGTNICVKIGVDTSAKRVGFLLGEKHTYQFEIVCPGQDGPIVGWPQQCIT